MHTSSKLLTLPATLLLLLLSSPTQSFAESKGQSPAQWRHDNPANSKYPPGGSLHRKREFEAARAHIRAGHAPFVVKKMTEDESEMFFPEYWGFREQIDQFAISDSDSSDDPPGWPLRKESEGEDEAGTLMNASTALSMRPPFLVRAMQKTTLSERDIRTLVSRHIKSDKNAAAAALALLEKRQFVCPTGMSPCSNMPSVCCNTGESCVPITDNGLGSIGCCPKGFTCSGPISCVPGNIPCNSTIGGGCCGPGDVCATIGCVPTSQVNTATTATTVVATSTQVPIPSTNLIIVTTVVTPSLSASASTSTLTVTASPSSEKTTTLTAATTVTSSPSTTGTTSPSAPARVSSSGTTAQPTIPSTTPMTSATDTSCPTGYYVCSAFYPGGCCRVGRDCSEINCPSTAYTTLISSGQTIVVPLTGAATTVASGTCATGWSSCAATDGGNCCPNGWSCGQESCTSAGATATQTEAKEGVLVNEGAVLMSGTRQLLGVYCLITFLLLIA